MRGPPLTTLSPYTTLFRSKKHILCEKPIATNVADAKDMIQVCEDEGVKLQIAYPVRFSGPIAELKAMIDNGELGEDRKSTRLNSSHVAISYAVFCFKQNNA